MITYSALHLTLRLTLIFQIYCVLPADHLIKCLLLTQTCYMIIEVRFPPALIDIIAEIYLKSKTNSGCSNGWPINNLSPLRSTQLWERDLRSLQFSWAAPSTEWKCTNSNWLRSLSTTVAVSDLQAPYSTPYNAGIRQTLYLWIPSQRAVLNWQYIVNCHLIELAIFSGRPSSQ